MLDALNHLFGTTGAHIQACALFLASAIPRHIEITVSTPQPTRVSRIPRLVDHAVPASPAAAYFEKEST
jgi:hypothetical protein